MTAAGSMKSPRLTKFIIYYRTKQEARSKQQVLYPLTEDPTKSKIQGIPEDTVTVKLFRPIFK